MIPNETPEFSWIPLSTLKPWLKNPRHNDHAISLIAASIRRFGFVAPVVIWKETNRLVAGHTRMKALAFLLKEDPEFVPKGAPGPGLVPTRFQSFATEEEANAYALADNKLAEVSDWNEAELKEILTELSTWDRQVAEAAGWNEVALQALLTPPALPASALGKEVDENLLEPEPSMVCPQCHHQFVP